MGPGDLQAALQGLFDGVARDPNTLVGFGTLDDAGVYRLSDTQALVQTVDFITPVVDDPFAFGEIAVANALSDVYAMGGQPLTALNIVCYPGGFDAQILHEILRGGLSQFTEAGVVLLGGHTVDDPEIKYGAAVTGLIDPRRIWSNAGARPGDILILTKPLGTGVTATGVKQGKATADGREAAARSMRTLNRAARDAVAGVGAHACTDVTGFGLMGHLSHLVRASGVRARLDASQIPLLPGALALMRQGVAPGGLERNKAHFGPRIAFSPGVEAALGDLLFDPQTSGGLLVSLPGDKGSALLADLAARGVSAARIGEITGESSGDIVVE